MSDDSDGQLIERCRQGDRASWETLVNRYSALVYSIPRRYRLPTSDCDDVHQAVFAALVTGLANLKNVEALPKWLMTSAHRETWRVSRARSRLVDTDGDFVSVSEPHESLVEELEQVAIVRCALAELGGRCQQLLLLVFGSIGESSYERIASELKIPIGSIGPTRLRCMAKLKTILEKMGIRPERRAASDLGKDEPRVSG